MKDDIILQVENLHTGFLVDNVPPVSYTHLTLPTKLEV